MSKSLYTVIISPYARHSTIARARGEALAAEWSELVDAPAHGSGPGYLIVRTDLLPKDSALVASLRAENAALRDELERASR